MRCRLWFSFATVLAGAGIGLAQPGPVVPAPATLDVSTMPPMDGIAASWPNASGDSGSRFWASAEYLLWWIKDGPLPLPLAAAGPPGGGGQVTVDPRINLPGTRVLNPPLDFGSFSGGRLSAGWWLDAERTFGIEGTGFLLEKQVVSFQASNPGTDSSNVLFVPFIAAANGQHGESTIGFNNPPAVAGDVAGRSSSQFGGFEINGVYNLGRGSALSIELLAGFRYLDLQEDLHLFTRQRDVTNSFGGFDLVTTDCFETRNQFYGGQVGGRVGFEFGRFSVAATAKVALGAMHEMVNITGTTQNFQGTIVGNPLPAVRGGGIFAQPSNIGRNTRDTFAIVPEAEVKAGFRINSGLRATVGYNFLYMNKVVRPGNQIDPVLNLSQDSVPVLVGLPITAGGPIPQPGQRPTALFNNSDFWAQGINFGLEYRY